MSEAPLLQESQENLISNPVIHINALAGQIPIKKLKIGVISSGSRGDVQPYIAMALHLQARGHEVFVASEKRMQGLVEGYGLTYRHLSGDPTGVLFEPKAQKALKSGSIFQLISLTNEWEMKFDKLEILNSYITALDGAEVIISGGLTMTPSFCVAEKWGIPFIPLILGPTLVTSEFPLFVMEKFIFCRCLNKWSYNVAFKAMWDNEKKVINPWRQNMLNIPILPDSGKGILDILDSVRPPILLACSRIILPRFELPGDYPSNVHMHGFVYVPTSTDADVDPKLIEFVQSDPKSPSSPRPILYLGFGSMPAPNVNDLIKMSMDICDKSNCRVVLIAGWSELFNSNGTNNDTTTRLASYIADGTVIALKAAPHDWLFPRVQCIVHHCGIGTTAAALRSGIPQIPCPFMLDQPHNARILINLKVAHAVVPYNDSISATKISNVLNVIFDPIKGKVYRETAKNFKDLIAEETIVAMDKYSEVIEGYCAKWQK